LVPNDKIYGTGDHVGEFDVWNMKVGSTNDEKLAEKLGETVQVASIRVDDIIQGAVQSDEERVFIAKVDTQGYEPSVFAGLAESVFQQQRIDFILFEYWPKGMDLLSSTGEEGSDHTKACIASGLLEKLQKAGYTLYALPNTAHPQAPKEARSALKHEHAPFNDARDNCEYYYQLEQRFPSDEYKMGYWSDILAVAPKASLVQSPVTLVGEVLMRQKQLAAPSIKVS
jgi:Methyltransferase FkbM domain